MENHSSEAEAKRFAFTIARIERLKPKAKNYYRYDAEVSQLVIRVNPTGSKSFAVYTSHLGKPWYQKIADFNTSISIDEVRKAAARMLLKLQSGSDPKKEKNERKECMTLGELMAWYAEDAKTSGQKSLYQVEYLFEKYIKPLANSRLMDITTGDLSRLVRPLLVKGKKTQSNRIVSFIARLYNYAARKHGYRGDNPTHHWKYEKEKPSLKFMSKDTFEKFIEEAKRTQDSDMRDLFLVLCYTGCRVSNGYRMKFSEIDFEQNKWIIPSEKSKNCDDMVIDLSDKLVALLKARREVRRGDSVFPHKEGSRTAFRWHYRKAFDEICKRAGISGYHVHCLRKTYGAYMISVLNKSIYETGKALGHKQIKTTERSYGKMFDSRLRQNANDMANALP